MFQTTCDCVTVNVLRRTPETRPGRWGTDWAKVPHLSAPSPRQLISPRLRLALISSLCLCVLLWTSPPSGHLCSEPKSNMKSSVWVVVHSVTDWKADFFFFFSHTALDGLTTTTTTGSAAPTASLCFTHPQHLTCGPWIRIPGLHTCCGWHTHTHTRHCIMQTSSCVWCGSDLKSSFWVVINQKPESSSVRELFCYYTLLTKFTLLAKQYIEGLF